MSDTSNVYFKIQKTDSQQIVGSVDEFKGHEFFSIRQWYLDEETHEYRPTTKGVTGSINEPLILDEMIAGLTKMRSELFGEG